MKCSFNLNIYALTFQTLRNVPLILITVIWMPTAPTAKDHSTARVIRDTLEMESRVMVL